MCVRVGAVQVTSLILYDVVNNEGLCTMILLLLYCTILYYLYDVRSYEPKPKIDVSHFAVHRIRSKCEYTNY